MSPEYYRKQARLCRKRAYATTMREMATKWLAMADEYEQLALSLVQTGAAPRTVH
jgi:hypothetical protein